MNQEELDKRVEERVKEDLTPIDTEERYRDMLDECYSFDSVGGIFSSMQPSRVLEEVDPVAYRCGMNDYEDCLREDYEEIDEQFYEKQEVREIREEIEAEMEVEEEEAREREEAEAEESDQLDGVQGDDPGTGTPASESPVHTGERGCEGSPDRSDALGDRQGDPGPAQQGQDDSDGSAPETE